jgi:hypothetical protein
MSEDAVAGDVGGTCGQQHEVPDPVAQRIEAVPGGAYEVPDQIECALEAGHPGEHLSMLQAWGENEEWLAWSAPTVRRASGCRADGMTCLLPAGHSGRHHVILTDVVADEGPFWCADRAAYDALRRKVG